MLEDIYPSGIPSPKPSQPNSQKPKDMAPKRPAQTAENQNKAITFKPAPQKPQAATVDPSQPTTHVNLVSPTKPTSAAAEAVDVVE